MLEKIIRAQTRSEEETIPAFLNRSSDIVLLTEQEKTIIQAVLQRDDSERRILDTKISVVRREIQEIRKAGALTGSDDQNKICARCKAKFRPLKLPWTDQGQRCLACKFKVCTKCSTGLSNGYRLCVLCDKYRQEKILTGEWMRHGQSLGLHGTQLLWALLWQKGQTQPGYEETEGNNYTQRPAKIRDVDTESRTSKNSQSSNETKTSLKAGLQEQVSTTQRISVPKSPTNLSEFRSSRRSTREIARFLSHNLKANGESAENVESPVYETSEHCINASILYRDRLLGVSSFSNGCSDTDFRGLALKDFDRYLVPVGNSVGDSEKHCGDCNTDILGLVSRGCDCYFVSMGNSVPRTSTPIVEDHISEKHEDCNTSIPRLTLRDSDCYLVSVKDSTGPMRSTPIFCDHVSEKHYKDYNTDVPDLTLTDSGRHFVSMDSSVPRRSTPIVCDHISDKNFENCKTVIHGLTHKHIELPNINHLPSNFSHSRISDSGEPNKDVINNISKQVSYDDDIKLVNDNLARLSNQERKYNSSAPLKICADPKYKSLNLESGKSSLELFREKGKRRSLRRKRQQEVKTSLNQCSDLAIKGYGSRSFNWRRMSVRSDISWTPHWHEVLRRKSIVEALTKKKKSSTAASSPLLCNIPPDGCLFSLVKPKFKRSTNIKELSSVSPDSLRNDSQSSQESISAHVEAFKKMLPDTHTHRARAYSSPELSPFLLPSKLRTLKVASNKAAGPDFNEKSKDVSALKKGVSTSTRNTRLQVSPDSEAELTDELCKNLTVRSKNTPKLIDETAKEMMSSKNKPRLTHEPSLKEEPSEKLTMRSQNVSTQTVEPPLKLRMSSQIKPKLRQEQSTIDEPSEKLPIRSKNMRKLSDEPSHKQTVNSQNRSRLTLEPSPKEEPSEKLMMRSQNMPKQIEEPSENLTMRSQIALRLTDEPSEKPTMRSHNRPKLQRSKSNITRRFSHKERMRMSCHDISNVSHCQEPARDSNRDINSGPAAQKNTPEQRSQTLAPLAAVTNLRGEDSRESVYSVYSDAGEVNYGRIPVTGDIMFSLGYSNETNTLEIHVIQCRDLAPVDQKHNRSDPYVKIYLLPDKTRGSKRKTKIKKHTLSPVFDEVLKYQVTSAELKSRTVSLTVWHNDRFGRNDFLGEVILPLNYYRFDETTPSWYPLQERVVTQDPTICYKGDLFISLKYVPPDMVEAVQKKKSGAFGRKNKEKEKPALGEVHVLVREAQNLTAMRGSAGSNPFCKGYLLPHASRASKQKTPVIKKTTNPQWSHILIFEGVNQSQLHDYGLELTIWDHEKLSSNDFLGGVRINLGQGVHKDKPADWMDARGEEIEVWQNMIDRPNEWLDAQLPLRASMGKQNERK